MRVSTVRKWLVLISLAALAVTHWGLYLSTTRAQRECRVPWRTWVAEATEGETKLKIALVTMSTNKAQLPPGSSANAHNARQAQFRSILELTGPNKQAYAKRHGYDYIDASDQLDASRPASWSKLLAVQAHLRAYDWVMWVDADTLITNMGQRLEDLLPAGQHPDLLLTRDPGGVNAGVWFVRSSAWGAGFLQRWWGADRYVRPMGDTKSGDNDALKDFVRDMEPSERAQHVGIAPQCAFNSYLWRHSLRNWLRYLAGPRSMVQGLWQRGDFLLHPAGLHDKARALRGFMEAHGLMPPTASGRQRQQGLEQQQQEAQGGGADVEVEAAEGAHARGDEGVLRAAIGLAMDRAKADGWQVHPQSRRTGQLPRRLAQGARRRRRRV